LIENISFIVIARNEEFGVNKCLESIAAMKPFNCEVICVDSDSSDNTLEVMKSYTGKIDNLRVVQISGNVKPPAARNAGMKYATKPYIFFVDGDIAIYPEFIHKSIEKINAGKADAVTGKLFEIQYSPDYQKKIREHVRRKHFMEEKKAPMTGGIFLAKKSILDKAGAWDESLRYEDFDYTIRISRHGILLQVPEFIGTHHTQVYRDRSWERLRAGYYRYYGQLFRKNADSPKILLQLLRGNRGLATFICFLFAIVICLTGLIASSEAGNWMLMALPIFVFTDFLYSTRRKKEKLIQWVLNNYLIPPQILAGIFSKIRKKRMATTMKIIV